MKKIIFYSWQSDLPNAANRGFIQRALENAAAIIAADGSLAIEPVVDRDTQGVAGSPDIASTIFAKISAADIVVVDVSIIGRLKNGRFTPNPNALIELGYAFKAIGHDRVILVFNEAFGQIQQLPFDLRMRRLVVYNMPEKVDERSSQRKELEAKFNDAIRAALDNLGQKSIDAHPIAAVKAIENIMPNRMVVLRQNLDQLFNALNELEPPKHSAGGTAEDLIAALDETQESTAEFSKICEITAIMNDHDAMFKIHKWFGRIFEKYYLPEGYSGKYSRADFDYFKFIGHELFITFIAFLIKENRWEEIILLLNEPIPLQYRPNGSGPGNEYWKYASEYLLLLGEEGKKRNRVSLHADILHNRHTSGGLATILPFDDLVAADFFLFLFEELPPETAPEHTEWRAWSCLYMDHPPMFLLAAENKKNASRLVKTLGTTNVGELKRRLKERLPILSKLFNEGRQRMPIKDEEIERIGTH